jgi:hypothetical protein
MFLFAILFLLLSLIWNSSRDTVFNLQDSCQLPRPRLAALLLLDFVHWSFEAPH